MPKDFSILLIKPEIFSRRDEVLASLMKRGYEIIEVVKLDGWKSYARKMYTEFNTREIDFYLQTYDNHHWGDTFYVVFLSHPQGDTLHRLWKEKGHFLAYQTAHEYTIRKEFGLPASYNRSFGRFTFVYCGVHTPADEKELERDGALFLPFLSTDIS